MKLNDWHPDCGGDWVLSGPGYFANYWPDNSVSASVSDAEGVETAASPIIYRDTKAECFAYAERWIRAHMDTTPTEGKTVADQTKSPAETLLTYFQYAHLPQDLASVSEPYAALAHELHSRLPAGAETTTALRKLLESKDCAVRAALALRDQA